jgi:hypothetical protein
MVIVIFTRACKHCRNDSTRTGRPVRRWSLGDRLHLVDAVTACHALRHIAYAEVKNVIIMMIEPTYATTRSLPWQTIHNQLVAGCCGEVVSFNGFGGGVRANPQLKKLHIMLCTDTCACRMDGFRYIIYL